MLALAAPVWIVLAGLLLFGVLVVLRFSLGLVRETRMLAGRIRRANERLREALGEVREGARQSSDLVEGMRDRGPRARGKVYDAARDRDRRVR